MKRAISAALLTLVASSTIFCQDRKSAPEKPKLIVEIVVAQMRFDYIDRYWAKFRDDGFKKLVGDGTYCKNARFNYLLTQSYPGLATISTGANPAVHGIIANRWYSRASGSDVAAVADDKVSTVGGSYWQGMASAKNLIISTFADELCLSNPSSKVIGIALDAGSAILATGHNAKGVFWLDTEKGGWISSSYYCESLPSWVDTLNSKKLSKLYVEKQWKAINPIGSYEEADTASIKSPTLKERTINKLKSIADGVLGIEKKNTSDYNSLLETPYGNLYTKDMAIAAIDGEGLGKDEHTDFISVVFSANRQIGSKYGPHSLEMEDTYLKLDGEIAHLLNFINHTVGVENVLVVLTSDQGIASTPDFLSKSKIPGGYFNSLLAYTLLNSYLGAIYGQGNWVLSYSEKQIFLNRKLIEESKLSIRDFQQRVADFMIEFRGVAGSTTAHTLQTTSFSNGIMEKFQNSFNQRRSGDVMINLEPGWVEEGRGVTGANSPYDYDTHVPLVLYGWKMKRKVVLAPVDMIDIAPTLSTLTGITWPNGAMGKPIQDIIEM